MFTRLQMKPIFFCKKKMLDGPESEISMSKLIFSLQKWIYLNGITTGDEICKKDAALCDFFKKENAKRKRKRRGI